MYHQDKTRLISLTKALICCFHERLKYNILKRRCRGRSSRHVYDSKTILKRPWIVLNFECQLTPLVRRWYLSSARTQHICPRGAWRRAYPHELSLFHWFRNSLNLLFRKNKEDKFCSRDIIFIQMKVSWMRDTREFVVIH